MRFPRGLAPKLFVSHLAIAAVVLVGLTAYSVDRVQRAYIKALERALEDEATLAAEFIGPALANGSPPRLARLLGRLDATDRLQVMVLDRNGVVVGGDDPEAVARAGTLAEAEGLDQALGGERYGGSLSGPVPALYLFAPVRNQGQIVGALRISYTLEDVPRRIGQLLTALGIGVAAAAAVAVALAMLLAYRLSLPARKLAAAADAVANGNLSYRTNIRGDDEFAKAGHAFDSMAGRLQENDQQRELLLASLSHEIHSTVTGMSMASELLESGVEERLLSRQSLLIGLKARIQQLKRLADDLLESARASRGTLELRWSEVRPEELVSETLAAFNAESALKSVPIDAFIPEGLPSVLGDKDRLRQALSNLLENALRHSPTGARVQVRVSREPAFCSFSVIDDGPGLPDEASAETIATDRPTGRLGLGLAIVREIVELHGGRFLVANKPGGGTICQIQVPLAPPEAAGPVFLTCP